MLRRAGLLLTLLPLTIMAEGTLYKWVDESGKSHYSDTPPLQTPRGLVELNRQGSVTRTLETPQERVAREAREAAGQAEAAHQRYQARYDQGLVESYQSAEQLRSEREKQLAAQRGLLGSLQHDLKTLQQDIARQAQQAEMLQKSGKPPQPALTANLATLRQQQAGLEAAIRGKQGEITKLTQKMQYDLERYRQLTQH